jgi:hypothetical protein
MVWWVFTKCIRAKFQLKTKQHYQKNLFLCRTTQIHLIRSTSIQYAISNRQFVSIKVYDVLGNEIETLVNEEKPAGNYEVTWYAKNLPSGVYFYQLRAGEFIQTRKMLLLK